MFWFVVAWIIWIAMKQSVGGKEVGNWISKAARCFF